MPIHVLHTRHNLISLGHVPNSSVSFFSYTAELTILNLARKVLDMDIHHHVADQPEATTKFVSVPASKVELRAAEMIIHAAPISCPFTFTTMLWDRFG